MVWQWVQGAGLQLQLGQCMCGGFQLKNRSCGRSGLGRGRESSHLLGEVRDLGRQATNLSGH